MMKKFLDTEKRTVTKATKFFWSKITIRERAMGAL